MKIYTKYGDEGFTRLYGGQRVSKTHVRVEAYGTMDEVCSLLGVIIAEIREDEKLNDVLGNIPQLPKLECFVIPGGSRMSSMFHLMRTSTRSLERKMIAVIEAGEDVNKIGLQYINRLSDYFFVIACLVNLKLGINETVYKKSKKIFKVKNEK